MDPSGRLIAFQQCQPLEPRRLLAAQVLTPSPSVVNATAESVVISGERKSESKIEEKGMTRTEFRYGKFQRILPLPGRISHQDIVADYKNGVLKLTLPKAEEEKNRVVKVSINQN